MDFELDFECDSQPLEGFKPRGDLSYILKG